MRSIIASILVVVFTNVSLGQVKSFGSYIKDGNSAYEKKNFREAEKSYRRSLEKEKGASVGEYNLADALYKQKKYNEAADLLKGLTNKEKNKEFLSDIYHNLGNSLLAEKKYEESIDAYKNSLRLKPDDKNTRYNLSYALSKLKQQQKQQKQQKNNKDNKNKQQENKQDQQQKKNDNKNKQDNKQEKEPQNGKMSKDQAEQLLDAIARQEKDLNEKMKKKKARAGGYKPEKDW